MKLICDETLVNRAHLITERFATSIIDADRFAEDAARSGLASVQVILPGSLDNGHVGAALFLAAMAKASGDRTYRKAAHIHLERAVNVGLHSIGLYSGWAGILAVARYIAGNGRDYKDLIETLRGNIETALYDFCTRRTAPISVFDFDIVGGVAGTLLALDRPIDDASALYFEWLTADEMRWRLPIPGLESVRTNNLGVAHGLAGVLMTLTLSAPESWEDLKERFVRYILQSATTDSNGVMLWGHGVTSPPRISCGWCYGSASIASAVCEASRQLGRSEWMRWCIHSMEYYARLTATTSEIIGWGLCHGKAGIMLQRAAFARRIDNDIVGEGAQAMLRTVIEEYDHTSPFGYATVLPSSEVDSNSLLLGAAGTCLAILSLTTDIDISWMRTCLALPV